MTIQTLPDLSVDDRNSPTVKKVISSPVQVLPLPAPTQLCRIFISYSHNDAPYAQRLHAALEKAGHHVWIDNQNLIPGKPWDETVKMGLNQTDVVLPILTSHSTQSNFVLNEIAYALEKNKLIIPIKWDAALRRPDDWPLNLIRLYFVDFTVESVENALQALIAALSQINPTPEDDPPTPTSGFGPLELTDHPTVPTAGARDNYYVNEGQDDRDVGNLLIIEIVIPDNLSQPVNLHFSYYLADRDCALDQHHRSDGYAASNRYFDTDWETTQTVPPNDGQNFIYSDSHPRYSDLWKSWGKWDVMGALFTGRDAQPIVDEAQHKQQVDNMRLLRQMACVTQSNEHFINIYNRHRGDLVERNGLDTGECLGMAHIINPSQGNQHHHKDFILSEWSPDPDHLKQCDKSQSLIHQIESIVDRAFQSGEVSEFEARLRINKP